MTNIIIAKISKNDTVNYAVDELYRCLKTIDDTLFIDIRSFPCYVERVQNVIWVGESENFASKIPEVSDKRLDDSIYIHVENNAGIITGCNPRSVLIAAYRFLRELGVAWVRPTDDGEVIPSFKIDSLNVNVVEKASYRHRAVCIEGATSYEHVLNMIKWIPRVGMSGYFFQFFRPTHFFKIWYDHTYNPYYASENISRENIDSIVSSLTEEIEKRGLLLHKVGHGWTCEPFGIAGDSWEKLVDPSVPENLKNVLAQIGGERKFYHGIPLNTNLCYSNKAVRTAISSKIAQYCEENRDVKYLHFWLADSSNNNCECEACVERPSDYFVMMLNEADEILTKKGIDTKIVFLVYFDLLWAPIKEKLNNPDRFVLMFAPISRTYTSSYDELDMTKEYKDLEYVKNKLTFPKEVEANFALLSGWKKVGYNDSFLFDYHIMWDHLLDPGYCKVSEIIMRDMKSLHKIGLNGMVSCQLTRCSFPTNLPMQMMADALWDENCDFEERSDKYFLSAFGEDGLSVKKYLSQISDYLDPVYSRAEGVKPYEKEMRLQYAKAAKEEADRFAETINQNIAKTLPAAQKKSWEYLVFHTKYIDLYASCIIASIGSNEDEKNKCLSAFTDFVNKNEEYIHKTLDVSQAPSMVKKAMR